MFLGIDCGTQGTKALLIDSMGNSLGRGYARHSLIERPNGAREQDPAWWVAALKTAVGIALASSKQGEVEAVAVSGQQHGLVVLDDDCKVIRPAKLWNDTETSTQNAELIERLGGKAECLRRFGILPLTGYTVSKLLWLRQREPENFAKIRHILLPHEYLNFWLTGVMRSEAGDASGTGYFDVRSLTWIEEILGEIDGGSGHLFRALPTMAGPTDILGPVLSSVASELGLSPDCLVAAGGGDNMMGAIGTGNVAEGVVTMSLGTSSTVYSFRKHPPQSADAEIAPFCSSSGGWLPLVCTMNATNVVNSMLNLFEGTVDDIEAALTSTDPGAGGLTLLPFFHGERTPDLPGARGSLHGITSSNLTAQNLIRSTLEGVTFGILNGLQHILNGAQPEVIVVIGGGARSHAWRQLLADATGALIKLPLEAESGCLGACIQALVALSHHAGHPVSFAEATSRIVQMNTDSTLLPDPDRRAKYDAARLLYAARLLETYPQIRQQS